MIVEIKIPSPGESISEVEIASWLVKDGDIVSKDQPIAEIDSDKATLELPAELAGEIKILVEDGSTVAVGDVVCTINTSKATVQDASQQAQEPLIDVTETVAAKTQTQTSTGEDNMSKHISKEDKRHYSPSARKISEELNLNIPQSQATGKGGRVTKADVIHYQAAMGSVDDSLLMYRKTSTKKMSLLRRKLSQRLVAVKSETAMLTTFNEVDMKPVMDLRVQYKERFKEKHGVSLGFMSFFTRAVTQALSMYPNVNSMIDGQNQIFYDYSDVGIAVSAPKGLMVPVLRNAERMTFSQIESEIKRLANLAREGKLSVDDMTGGTFTITNGGVFGSMLSTPIINPPQSAILGMHNIVERPVVIKKQNGKRDIEIRPIMYIALSYDHRVIDGKDSVGFLLKIKELLENPEEELIPADKNIAEVFEI